ncbi:molybdenum cofactor guanylyltransferase [Chloroflexota bacterium]
MAGGKSRRLGVDKVTSTLGDTPIMQRVVTTLERLCHRIIIVTGQARPVPELSTGVEIVAVADLFPGAAAVGGIYTGLYYSDTEYNITVACDMPFLNPELLGHMLKATAGYDVVLPRLGEEIEPLHAVYRNSCSTVIQEMLTNGDLRIRKMYEQLKVRYIESPEYEVYDPKHLSIFNINTSHDLARAKSILGTKTVYD